MEHLIFFFFIFLTFILLSQGLLQFVYKRSLIIEKRIETYFGSIRNKSDSNKHPKPMKPSIITKKLSNLVSKLKMLVESKLTIEAKSELEQKLRDAGLPYSWTPVDFRLMQFLIGAMLFSLSILLFGKSTENTASLFLLSGSLAALGYYYPTFYLSTKKKRRMDLIQKSLADFFDMINLSVEAGMGVDAAIIKACNNTTGPLSEEFTKALEEMRLGKSRREVFVNLRNRVSVDAFQSIMTSLIQADQLGIGMSKVLRTLTERIREHQRQLAREKAMKAPVKMMFPMLFFIFPSIFIVLLGPLVIYLIQYGL